MKKLFFNVHQARQAFERQPSALHTRVQFWLASLGARVSIAPHAAFRGTRRRCASSQQILPQRCRRDVTVVGIRPRRQATNPGGRNFGNSEIQFVELVVRVPLWWRTSCPSVTLIFGARTRGVVKVREVVLCVLCNFECCVRGGFFLCEQNGGVYVGWCV